MPTLRSFTRLAARIVVSTFVATIVCAVVAPAAAPVRAAGAGIIDYAPTFNGTSYFRAPDNDAFEMVGNFTVEAWLKPASTCITTATMCQFINKENSYEFGVENGIVKYAITDSFGNWNWYATDTTMLAGVWQHVALTVNRSTNTITMYYNGEKAGDTINSTQVPSVGRNSTGALTISGREANTGEKFFGDIDEVRIYSEVRSQANIRADMYTHGTTFNASNLKAYYDFNGASNTVLNDAPSAASGTDLTATGTFTWNDIKTVSTPASLNNRTVITFPRSYLTSNGGWTVPAGVTRVNALVVAGGGGGGAGVDNTGWSGGGGGAGGLRTVTNTIVTPGTGATVAVGGGGHRGINGSWNTEFLGTNGAASIFSSTSTVGGGYGGMNNYSAGSGGSGGGGGVYGTNSTAGSGTAGEGNNGGAAQSDCCAGGGGGGAGGAGGAGSGSTGGNAGNGVSNSITGTATFYAGGGVGKGFTTSGSAGSSGGTAAGINGTTGTGSGGGGGGGSNSTWSVAGYGGSGVVIVSYASPVAIDSTNRSMQFTGGSTSKVTVNDNNALDMNMDLTAEAWVYPTDTSCSGNKVFMGKENSYLFAVCNNFISFAFRGISGATWAWYQTTIPVSINTWAHFAFVRAGGRLTVYKNGGAAAGGSEFTTTTGVPTDAFFNSSDAFVVGGRPTCSTECFAGYIDDVRLWNYARSASAIAQNFNKRIASNVLYFPFDESVGTTVANHAASMGSTLNGTNTSATISAAWPSVNNTYTAANVYGFLPGYDYHAGGAITYAISQNGSKGTATVSASTGAFSYVANPGVTGNDTFTYSVTGVNGTATHTFTVTAPSQPMASARSFRQAPDVVVALNSATSLGYNNPSTAYTLGEIVRATLSVTNGTVNLTLSGTTVASGSLGSSSVTIDGTQSQINTALNSATVTATSPIPTRATLDLSMKPGDQVIGGNTYTWNSNGHYYRAMNPGTTTYANAQSGAQSMSLGGRPGYLATIQHSGENATIDGINSRDSYLGGSDRDLQGTYRWKGNDTNSIFRTGGTAYRGRYTTFASSEPNGENGSEDWVEQRGDGLWNDCQDACNRTSYIAEFDPMSSRTITELDFSRTLAATAQSARNLGLGTSFINTSTWANGEIVRVTLTASAGTVAYTAGSTTLVSGSSGSSTVTFEGTVANINTAINTATVTPSSAGSSTVSLTYGVKRATTGSYIYNATSDHFYLADTTGRLYASAKSTAEGRRWAGTSGYLVTVTSEAEHNTVRNLTNSWTWSGGSDEVSEGQWTWDSPDAFQIFADYEVGLAGAVSYFDPTGEPNNSGNFMTVNFGDSKAHWDDTGDTTYASITEFSPIDTTVRFDITATAALSFTAPSSGLAATNGTAYSLTLAASGGQTPYTYSVASGSLPTGLALNSSTGVISGTTSGPGTSNTITIRATDANDGTATTASFAITTTPAMCTTSTTIVGKWTVERVTSSGSCLWTVPTGVTSIDAFVVGAGGGGGADGAGGGGGGANQPISGVAVTAGENLTATLGAGGTGASHASVRASTSGGSTSLTRSGTTIASANGGAGGGLGPGQAAGTGGASTTGFAGGAGGAGTSVVAAGSPGSAGASNFFFGTETQYGGGGGGGSYNFGSHTFAIPSGASGGGNGCGSPTQSTNTTPAAGVRGGGGGAGCAGSAGRPDGASGGSGVVLIRYATDPLDAFPASIGTPAYRYVAENYQTLDSTRKQWIDASGNGRHSASVSGSPAVQSITGNGASSSIRALAGGTSEGVRFATFSPTTANAYTLFYVARYSGTARQRLFDGVNLNWLSGFYSGSVGVAHHTSWLTAYPNTGTTVTNWQLMTDQNTLLRQNGVNRASTANSQSFDSQLGLNAGYFGNGGGSPNERSDFNAAEVILYNGNLTATQIRQVENYLARAYDLQGYDFTNTALGANGPGTLTASKVGTVSTGNTTQLSLTWTAPQDTTGVSGYKVEYKKSSDSTWTTFAASASGTTSTITGLEAATAYNTRVTPVDSGAPNRPSITADATTWGTSSITLGSLPASPVTNSNYTLTATVSGPSSTSGTVRFMENGTTIGACGTTSVIGGQASCTWTPSTFGSRSITATFTGDTAFKESTTVSASSVSVDYGACSTSSGTTGRFTFLRVTQVGGCKISTLPSGVESVDVLVVGGGGGGGENVGSGGSGGGGYFAERVTATSASELTVIVGAGGRAGSTSQGSNVATTERDGGNGGASTVSWSTNTFTGNGGVGGQTHWADDKCNGTGWTNTTVPGGTGSGSGGTALTGGTGGLDSSTSGVSPSAGGAGFTNSITGTSTNYGGGGGGGGWNSGAGGSGGAGGGGAGAISGPGISGTANTGGGGGGGTVGCTAGGAGGSGIVIIRYANVPTIITQPAAVTKSTGQSHTFSVTPSATGAVSGDYTYQWRKDGVNISAATSSTYTLNSLTSTSAGDYSVVVKSFGSSGAVSTVTSSAGALTMTKANQAITFGSLADRVYGVADFTISSTNSVSLQNTFASTSTSVCTVASPTFSAGTTSVTVSVINAGTCSITASQAGDIDYNAANTVTQSFVVATKALTISGMTAANKEYDAATGATPSFTNASLVGVVSGDSVTINSAGATATFANKNAGNGKTVTASGVLLAGTHAARYSLAQPTALANITAKELTVTGITASNREYNATNSATALLNKGSAALSGVVSGDNVTLSTASATATFANKTVANNKVVTVAGLTISGTDSGNYTLTQPTTSANITLKELTVTGITANNRTYDATNIATNQLVTGSAALSGVVSGDNVTLSTSSATATFANKNVGTGKQVTVAGLTISGTDIANYTLTQPTTNASILAKELTVTGITASNREYNATDSATALLNKNSAALSGVISGDNVTLSTSSATATFANKNVANAKTVFVADLSISGTDSANYTLTQPTTSANITAKELTVTGITASNREYNATDSATALLNKNSAALSGVISGDNVTLSTASATATFANKNVGTNKVVTVAGITISGGDAGNYTLTQPTTNANITTKELTVTGITASNREYNATDSATALLNKNSAALSGVISGDNVTLSTASATATFANKNVGTNKVVTVAGITIAGSDSANYTLTQPTTNANITAKELTVTGITASNRGYDGTTTAVINTSNAAFAGVISGDDVVIVTISANGTFANANIGLGKTVQIAGITSSGTDAANYAITQPTATADIAAKTLTVTGITTTSRAYNGSVSATTNLNASNASLVGIENNDSITLVTSGIAGSFDNKNVGTNKTITVTGLTITGTHAANYTLVQPTLTTGRITTKQLTVAGITANNKIYDGNTSATSLLNKGSASLSGVVSGDNITLSTTNATATFADKFVSNGKTVTIAGITISGTDSGNYQLLQPQTQANVTPKELTVTGIIGVNRVYNASTNADGDLDASAATLVGVVGSDDVVLDTQSMTGTFNDKNVGTNKTITIADLSVYGNDIGNYTLTQPTASAAITAKTITVTGITASNREYNATDSATALLNKNSAALSGVVSGDNVTLSTSSATATFANKNVGTNKVVTVAGITIAGGDAGNYSLTQPTTNANITTKELTVTGITANNREYNATNSATALLNKNSAALTGVISGDNVTLSTSSATATFANKNVGTNKVVTVAGITIAGGDAGNYSLTQPATNANITTKELTVAGITATTKIYDGNTTATLTTSSAVLAGVVSGDSVTLSTASATGTFSSIGVASGKTVSISGLTISGGDAANYTLTQPTATADILSASAGLTWSSPSNIVYGTVLSATQQNAAASVAGQFTYTPAPGSKLSVGTHTLSVTFVPTNSAYDTETTTVSITVTSKTLTVTGITANNRTYDATRDATNQLVLGSAALSGVVNGDNVTLSTASATATFADKTVGVGKLVTVAGLTIDGGDAANYTLTQPTTNASILAKELTVTGITANNREYNATDSATALLNKNSATLSGVFNSDNVTLSTSSATATFATKTVAIAKTVFVADLTISGGDAANYTLTQPRTTANITTKELTVTGITANNKVYDQTTAAILNLGSAAFVGVISGDNVSISTTSTSGVFTNQNVGTNKTITISNVAKSGTDAANYSITQPTTDANITTKELTVTGITANNREYNATDSATALLNKGSAALSGVITGDNVALSTAGATATFANKNVGTNKTISVAGLTISGNESANYALTQPTTSANITAKELTVTGITTTSRPFNNTTSATALMNTSGASLSGVISGDNVTVSYASLTAVFADANVGASKPVTISGITIAGTDNGNYALTQPTATATISQATPVLTWSNPSDITFGTSLSSTQLNASAAFAQSTLAGTFNYSPTSGSRLDAGTHTLTATFTPTSANYATESTTVSITVLQKSVTVTADNESIVYGVLPQSTFTVAGLAVGDSESATTFTYAGTGGTSYSSSTTAPTNAGTYSITPSALTLSTGRLTNYAITYQAGTLNIAKAVQQPITATPSATAVTYAPAPNKTTVTLSSTGGSGDGAVTYTVAQNDPCSINGTTLTVDGAGSCSVTATKATSANFLSRASSPVAITVNKASQTLSLDSISAKTYGDSQFTVTTSATSGLTVSIAASPSTVCDVPSGQTIRIISTGTCTVTATQSGDSNWQSATVAAGSSSTRTFVISPKVLSILGATANNRTYDGTSDATAQISFGSASLSGVVSGDSVSINAANVSATFATKNIGSSKPITISGVELSGTHAHRYVVDTPTDLSANVTALTITVGGITVPTRAYNGTNVATLSTSTYAFTGVLNNDSVTLNDSSYVATFANANVSPTAKLVTVSGLLLSGTDAANYTLTQPTLQGFVVKATASVLLGPDVSAVYTGSPLAIATATQPSSLSLVMSYSGSGQTSYGPSASAPTNAGSYSALATVNDVNYQGNGTSPWTITKQTVSVQVSQSSLSQTFTGSVRPIAPSTSPSGMNISISYSGTNGNTYQSSWAPVNAGTYSVSVTVVEANFQGTITETLTVAKASQSPISLTNTSSLRFGTTLQLVPVGGSGSGAYAYSVSSGPCQVNDHSGVVTPNGVGNCSVVAHRESSTNYHSASSSPHALTISKGTQVAAFTSLIPSVPVTGSTYTPTATTTSGLAPTISVSTGAGSVCTLSNGTLTFNASGLCVLSASQSGDSNWLAATTATQSIEVGKLSQAITFPQPAAVDLGSPDFTLDASTSSGLPLTYSVTAGNSVCSISSIGIVSIASVGTCTIETLQAGDSTFAAASTVTRTLTVLPSLPAAPHITSISSGDSTVTVGFKAPHSNGGSAIVSYALVATSNTAPTVSRTDCSTSALSCTLVGLVNGTSYTVTVAAINVRGTGTPSDTEEVLIPLPTIAAARNIVGTRQSTTIDLTWEDPNTYGPGTFVHYEVYLKQRGGSFGAPVTVQSSDRIVRALTTQSRTVQFTQLDPSRLYESKIVTITSTASAETSENTATALVMPLSIPSAPRDLTVEAPSGTSARLSWRTPETDGGSSLQSYSVTTSAGTCSLSSPLATSCSITGLQPGASLSVSLRAVNAAGQSVPANTALTLPNVPGAPSLGVISMGTTFANISWTSPASNGGRVVTSYSVAATEVNQPSVVLRCTSAGLSCVINNLKATTQYSFTVKATNSVGTGTASAAVSLTTGRTASNEWDSYRTTTPVVLASQLSLPPAPARVTSQGVGGRRTQITAVRSARDAAIPVTYALISVSTRTNKLLARIKVIVDPQNPSTTVSVPYASSKVKIAVQFANDIGLSPGGPAGTNIAEGNTFEWTTVAGQVSLVGSQIPGGIYFARSSSQLTYTAQQTLKKMAATAKSRGGLVYVTGFAQRGESKSAWMLEPLARARAEAVAKYLSRLGVRQWITFHGTAARAKTGWKPITDRRVVVSTVYPTESSPTVSS